MGLFGNILGYVFGVLPQIVSKKQETVKKRLEYR
jgi:hypothetical protein